MLIVAVLGMVLCNIAQAEGVTMNSCGSEKLEQKNSRSLPEGITPEMVANPLKLKYTNYRGETAVRLVIPQGSSYKKTAYHSDVQWILEVYDIEREGMREYAWKDIIEILK